MEQEQLAELLANKLLGNCWCGGVAEMQERLDGKFDRLRRTICLECAKESAALRWSDQRCCRCSSSLEPNKTHWLLACEPCRRSQGITWYYYDGVPVEK